MKKAIFLDRDGVINEERGLICNKEEIFILPGVKEALRKLKEKGFILIVITNQPAVARGLLSEEELEEIHEFMNKELEGLIDKFYFCPHHPEMHDDVPEHAKKYRIKCDCRKPLPGMILKAVKEFDIELDKSWMIGDMISDIATGKSAGCKTIMVESPKNNYVIKSHVNFDGNIKADNYAKDLLEVLGYLEI